MNTEARTLRRSADGEYFRSKVDLFYGALMLVICVFVLVAGAVFTEAGWSNSNWDALVGGALAFLLVGFVGWVFSRTGYLVTRSELIVRSGPFRWRVPLASIEEVSAAGRWDKGPALSMDRLTIQYQGRPTGLTVSPADRDGFLNALLQMAPSLARTGDRLVRS